jgi:uncharacterized protein (DUF2235 family)
MKRIVLLSDGTGNSAAKLFKTNVWRLYQALDLAEPVAGDVPQVASYHDGVGTSSFKPLAILGGAFGWGLKRNVLDHYEYLCRTWQPGDEIYAFGFSRGAFTIRVVVGLIADQGLLRHCSDFELGYAARDAYRAYRRKFNRTGGLVKPLRWARDHLVIRSYRYLFKQAAYTKIPYRPSRDVGAPSEAMTRDEVPSIRFVGVFDTVAAYGTPLAELTRGIDDWVWPLSMPDNVLSPKVRVARHALALDDERDTFHPLLWDEVAEQRNADAGKVPQGRLQQVWFAGMHSDVGGGYPDDSLSYAPLHWMMRESEADMGLRYRPDPLNKVASPRSDSAPLHDSRRGLGGYYRYQPRKISARVNPPDPTARIMQDPDPTTWALLRSVMVHESVIERIRSAPDRYAPIVLPRSYAVVKWDGSHTTLPESPAAAAARDSGQVQVWNDVWRRRVNYFATVAVSLALALLPALEGSSLLEANSPFGLSRLATPFAQLASSLIQATERFLPAFAQIWLDAFARHPGVFSVLVVALVGLLLRGGALQRRIHDRMHALWRPLHGQGVSPPKSGWGNKWIQAVRTCPVYQTVLQRAKWQAVPFVFGASALIALVVIAASPVVLGVYRSRIHAAEADGTICGVPKSTVAEAPDEFDISDLCKDTGIDVKAGKTYSISLTVLEPWSDGTIDTTPGGFGPERMTWPLGYLAIPLRRSLGGNWLQPFAAVVPSAERSGHAVRAPQRPLQLDFRPAGFRPDGPHYVARFEAPEAGRVRLWVNDVVVPWQVLLMPWRGLTQAYYLNNRGKAAFDIHQDK